MSKISLTLHQKYPLQLRNEDSIVLAVKIIPTSLPKEGPPHLQNTESRGILMACNSWVYQGSEIEGWDWFTPPSAEIEALIAAALKENGCGFNQWYFIDIFKEENHDQSQASSDADPPHPHGSLQQQPADATPYGSPAPCPA